MKILRILFCILSALLPAAALPCTSAIVRADRTRDGRPLLYKHRDTSNENSRVEYIPSSAGTLAYVGLFNASDARCSQAWAGMNEAGFAIMNTASYNLRTPGRRNAHRDREGYVMARALQHCRTVADFESLLRRLPRPMGVEANFGVIDATGAGAYFEVNDDSFRRYDLADSPTGVLVRTNYSHSGRPGEGSGHVREANARRLILPQAASAALAPEFLTETVSRSFYRDLQGRDYLDGPDSLIVDADFIPRHTSVATVVIEGMAPQGSLPDAATVAREYIMWTGLGYPPCSEIMPVWCRADGVDDSLRGLAPGRHAAAADRARLRRDDVFADSPPGNTRYVDVSKLHNAAGTGYIQILSPQNLEVYRRFRQRPSDRPADLQR